MKGVLLNRYGLRRRFIDVYHTPSLVDNVYHTPSPRDIISANHPNIEPGSTVTVRIKAFKDVEGVWNIEYEK